MYFTQPKHIALMKQLLDCSVEELLGTIRVYGQLYFEADANGDQVKARQIEDVLNHVRYRYYKVTNNLSADAVTFCLLYEAAVPCMVYPTPSPQPQIHHAEQIVLDSVCDEVCEQLVDADLCVAECVVVKSECKTFEVQATEPITSTSVSVTETIKLAKVTKKPAYVTPRVVRYPKLSQERSAFWSQTFNVIKHLVPHPRTLRELIPTRSEVNYFRYNDGMSNYVYDLYHDDIEDQVPLNSLYKLAFTDGKTIVECSDTDRISRFLEFVDCGDDFVICEFERSYLRMSLQDVARRVNTMQWVETMLY